MSQWGSKDSANNVPKWSVDSLGVSTGNSAALFANTTTGAFVPNQKVGLYNYDSKEVSGIPGSGKGWVIKREGTGGRTGRVSYETLVSFGATTNSFTTLPFDPVLFIGPGDSNARGSAVQADQDAFVANYVANPNILALNATGTFSQYVPGTFTGMDTLANTGNVGLEIGFIRRFVAQYPNNKLYIIKLAKAGGYATRGVSIGSMVGSQSATVTTRTSGTIPTFGTLFSGDGTVPVGQVFNSVKTTDLEFYTSRLGYASGSATYASQTLTLYNSTVSFSPTEGALWSGTAGSTTNGYRGRGVVGYAAVPNPKIVAAIHMLGTNDKAAASDVYTRYRADMEALISSFKSNFSMGLTPITVARVRGSDAGSLSVRADQQNIVAADTSLRLMDMDSYTTHDGTHFQISQLDLIGSALFDSANFSTVVAIKANNNNGFVAGDSRATTTGPYTGTISGALQGTSGEQVYTRRLLKGQFDFNKNTVIGIGGITTRTFRQTYLPTLVAALTPGQVVDITLGVNDSNVSSGVTLADSQAEIDLIIAGIRGAGGIVVWDDEVPTSGDGISRTPGQQTGIRDYLRTKHNPTNGVYIARTWDLFATVPDGTTTKSGLLRTTDNLHFASSGSYLRGKAKADIMSAILPANDLTARTVVAGGEFIGTTGTLIAGTTTLTGVAPTGWTASVITGTTGSIVSSVIQSPYGDGHAYWRLVGTGVTALNLAIYSDIAGFTAGTDYIEGTMLAAIQPGSTNLIRISKSMKRQSGTYLQTVDAANTFDGFAASNTTEAFDFFSTDKVGPMLMRDQHVLFPVGATLLRHWIEVLTRTGVTSNFTIDLALPQASKYLGTLTD